MNQEMLAYLPVLSLIVTLIVVYIGVLAQNRRVDVRIRRRMSMSQLFNSHRERLGVRHPVDGAPASESPVAGTTPSDAGDNGSMCYGTGVAPNDSR